MSQHKLYEVTVKTIIYTDSEAAAELKVEYSLSKSKQLGKYAKIVAVKELKSPNP